MKIIKFPRKKKILCKNLHVIVVVIVLFFHTSFGTATIIIFQKNLELDFFLKICVEIQSAAFLRRFGVFGVANNAGSKNFLEDINSQQRLTYIYPSSPFFASSPSSTSHASGKSFLYFS